MNKKRMSSHKVYIVGYTRREKSTFWDIMLEKMLIAKNTEYYDIIFALDSKFELVMRLFKGTDIRRTIDIKQPIDIKRILPNYCIDTSLKYTKLLSKYKNEIAYYPVCLFYVLLECISQRDIIRIRGDDLCCSF